MRILSPELRPKAIRIALAVVSIGVIVIGVVLHHRDPTSLVAPFILHTGYFGALLAIGALLLELEEFRHYFEGITRRMLESIIRTLMAEYAFLKTLKRDELREIRRRATRAQCSAILHEKCDEVVGLLEMEIFDKLDGPHYEKYAIYLDHRIVHYRGREVIESTQTISLVLISADPNQKTYPIDFSTDLDKIDGLQANELLCEVEVQVDDEPLGDTTTFIQKAPVDRGESYHFPFTWDAPLARTLKVKMCKRTPVLDIYHWRASRFCQGLEFWYTHDERIRLLTPRVHLSLFGKSTIVEPNRTTLRVEHSGWVLPGQSLLLDWAVAPVPPGGGRSTPVEDGRDSA